ncbi:bifunctional transcriptional activator/DNA repair enzyme AdaA [Paenibacillus sp. CECT 9249]|uniref:bifunctional transcriptional activator/DNA repair enzyme AdaA n=1 Tax=unclassified Paenibacillus TaxID=185978 RepID=UPI001C10B6DA|nr:bifunctional transcriptional activator/DNA repair enzyme AdaA [Paenibacillus sp. CECT 9249]MBU5443224.1 bifunctional transcriptional activator/DNA repair enzyme AdaA [Paenibacillus sp. MSJ-34]CAH0121376.1 Bifunctional transcriptional activator/DNA repair enzyme AdaA [Paenibacillus sp. CECT 9249]
MDSKKTNIPDEYWKAIVECDPAYDDAFLYGVRTTGIFCRPSCKSKVPNPDNVRIFPNAYVALKEHFRPCKRCKPDGLQLPTEEWIEQVVEWIDLHYDEPLTLNMLADISHGSPFHLQRMFKKVKGFSPAEYIRQVRLNKAADLLQTTNQSVAEIGMQVGFSSTPYFITLFKKKLGVTPSSYREDRRNHDGNAND